MFIHWGLKEIHLKIVYYGPGLSGKTENLKYIHSRIDPSIKGELTLLNANEDRTLFFDFLQLEVGYLDGKTPKFNLYTVPGQGPYERTRRIVLNDVDGIVFVADSRKEMMDANLDTLLDLEKHLIENDKSLECFPWVLQYNKRDLPNIESIEEMEQKMNLFNVPSFQASAITGQGVFPALKTIIRQVVTHVQPRLRQDQRMTA